MINNDHNDDDNDDNVNDDDDDDGDDTPDTYMYTGSTPWSQLIKAGGCRWPQIISPIRGGWEHDNISILIIITITNFGKNVGTFEEEKRRKNGEEVGWSKKIITVCL